MKSLSKEELNQLDDLSLEEVVINDGFEKYSFKTQVIALQIVKQRVADKVKKTLCESLAKEIRW